tara:strand:- start:2536 stop:3732 length:1197 start_codon:yes stop_codon:yes gene_type:complete
MLGLPSASSSSSYLPFNSSKSISLDGTNEYLFVNDTFSSTFTDSFSISVWVKVDDGEPAATKYICGSSNSTSQDEVFIKISTAGLLGFVVKSDNDTGLRETDAAVFADGANDWKHIVCTATKSGSGNTLLTIYVNGSVVASNADSELTEANHTNFSTDIQFAIGALNNNGTRQGNFDGGVDEFGLWSSALSANAVSALYNNGKPTELSSPQGDYTAQADLVAWYRMGDGVHSDATNKKNAVANEVNSTLGSEELTNGTFDSDLSSWTVINDGAAEDSITWDSSGRAKIIYDADGTEAALGITQDTLTAGKVYRCQLDVEVIKVGSTVKVWNSAEIVSSLSNGTHIFYFRASNTHFRIFRTSASVDCEVYIDNFSVREVSGGVALPLNTDLSNINSNTP